MASLASWSHSPGTEPVSKTLYLSHEVPTSHKPIASSAVRGRTLAWRATCQNLSGGGLGLVPIASYVFPVAVITNHHQHSGLKQHVCIIFHFWRLKYIKSSCCCCCFLQNQQGCVLSRSSRIYFFARGSFQRLPALPDLWPLPPPSRPATRCLRIFPSALHLYYHLSFSASDLLTSFLEGPCDYTVSTWTIQDHLPTTRPLITCTKSPRSGKPVHPFTGRHGHLWGWGIIGQLHHLLQT